MIYVIKKFIESLETVSYVYDMKFTSIEDEEYPEFWQKHSLEYFENLDDESKEKFAIFYPKYMAEVQYPKIQDWNNVDEYVRAEWKDYLTKIHNYSYWHRNNSNSFSVPLFKDDTDEEFFNYVVSYMSNKTKLNGAMLSYLYHILSSWFIGKQKEYLSYCKKYNIQFNQIAQRDRHSNLNPSYDSDISVYRRNSFESAQKSWNESNKKQYNFSKEIKAD